MGRCWAALRCWKAAAGHAGTDGSCQVTSRLHVRVQGRLHTGVSLQQLCLRPVRGRYYKQPRASGLHWGHASGCLGCAVPCATCSQLSVAGAGLAAAGRCRSIEGMNAYQRPVDATLAKCKEPGAHLLTT